MLLIIKILSQTIIVSVTKALNFLCRLLQYYFTNFYQFYVISKGCFNFEHIVTVTSYENNNPQSIFVNRHNQLCRVYLPEQKRQA